MNERLVENISIEILEKINSSDNILLTTHLKPDGDALSSLCTMIEVMEIKGRKYSAVITSALPDNFSYLPNAEKIKIVTPGQPLGAFDLLIALDCPNLSRTGLENIESCQPYLQTVIIDHHPSTGEKNIDQELRVDTAASTTEVLYYFLHFSKIEINQNIASCILTGISTDTGNFLYPSTSTKTMEIASLMMEYGAKLPRIVDYTWRNKTFSAMKLWGKAMSSLHINPEYNIAYAILTREDLGDSGVDLSELEGVSGFLSNLEGVKAILLLVEEDDDIIKGSWRTSDQNMDVSKFAKIMGGGGHKKAAAFRVKGKIERTQERWKIV